MNNQVYKTFLKALKASAGKIVVTLASLILISMMLNAFLSFNGVDQPSAVPAFLCLAAFTLIGFFIGREYQKIDISVMK